MNYRAILRGAQFRSTDEQEQVLKLAIGDTVELQREPSNKYDKNAIKIMAGPSHLGYVERGLAYEIAPELEANGDKYTATVVDFQTSYAPILDIEVPVEVTGE